MRLTIFFIIYASSFLFAEEPLPKDAKASRGYATQDSEHVFYCLKGKLKWELGGRTVLVKVDGAHVDFTAEGSLIYRITAPRHLDGMVSSRDGSVIVLLTTRSDRTNPFYDSLVRLRLNAKGGVEATELLPGAAKGFNNSDRWVQEVGAVSNDGRFVLVKMSRSCKRDENRMSYFYDWELWDTQKSEMVRRGLLVSDANPNGDPDSGGPLAARPESK